MQLSDKVGQMLMVGFHGLEAPSHILEWLAEGKIGGVILFARNVESPEQLARLCSQLYETAKYPILIGIDQEGGAVARLREGFIESPGAMALSATGDEALTEQVSGILAEEMAALGINWTYAPAVDISYNKDNPTVGVRSFGNDKEVVSQFASAAVRGFQSGNVAACAKHFPGLGDTAIDTHLALATLDVPLEQVVLIDLLPYRVTIDAGLATIMTTHTVFSAIDKEHPATLSPLVIKQLLRGELGFEGVVTTDCMEMKAIADNYGAGESAVLAMLAGVDIILFSHTKAMQEAAYQAMLEAAESGRVAESIIDSANARIAKLKADFPAKVGDLSAIRREDNLKIVNDAARKSIVMLKNTGLLPLQSSVSIGLIEFASYLDSIAVESGGMTGLAEHFKEAFPSAKTMAVRVGKQDEKTVKALENLAKSVDILIVATRNAHLWSEECESAKSLLAMASKSILLALRNPYDVDELEADVILCSCGDSAPSLIAIVDALAGEFEPSGKLPVKL